MEDLSVIQWAAGGAMTLVCAGVAHLHLRILDIEKQLVELLREAREDTTRNIDELWNARDQDRNLREKDKEEVTAFRQYVLTTLATREDINNLEIRVSGAVRMIVNDRHRKGIDLTD